MPSKDKIPFEIIAAALSGPVMLGVVALIWNGFISAEFGLKPLDLVADLGLSLLIFIISLGAWALMESKPSK